MLNFDLKNPTRILFGKGQIEKISELIPKDAKVLLTYGGGSIKANGIYEQVTKALDGYTWLEFGGIPANPEYEILLKGLEIIRREKIDFLLAVGGGSVIDGTKFLSAAAKYNDEPWEILTKYIKTAEDKALPFGCVLTLPATGSEMNSGAVISRKETKEKLGMGGAGLFPQFSILDPEVVRSIPKNQLANGVCDAYTHVLEQYMTYPTPADLQERFAESILISLQETAPKLLNESYHYDTAANFMWCCTMALNGQLQKGVPSDWAIHAMGHELTALHGIDHARTLAIVAPSYYRKRFEHKKAKLAQYAQRVWGLNGSETELSKAGINKMESFFQSLGIPTQLSEYVLNVEGTAEIVADQLRKRNWIALGEHKDLSPEEVKEIIKNAY